MKKAQAAMEYLILVGFITFVLLGILSIAFIYSESIKDRLKMTQVENFANKVIATSETVFYSGKPSKATISVYLPKGVEEILITPTSMIISVKLSTGLTQAYFPSTVPISGNIPSAPGIKRITITAQDNEASANV